MSTNSTGYRFNFLVPCRGLACLWVLIYHIFSRIPDLRHDLSPVLRSFIQNGYLGVALFFVISGYSIAHAIEKKRPGIFFFRRYYRIFPTYWASMVFALALSGIGYLSSKTWDYPEGLGYWLSQITLTQPLWGYGFLVGPYWSLHLEVQFYIVMGLLLFINKRYLIHLLFLISAVWYMLGLHLSSQFYCIILTHWPEFYLGILIFETVRYQKQNEKWKSYICIGLIMAIMGIALWRRDLALGLSAFFTVALILVRPADNFLYASNFLKPVYFLGTISYSLYLIQLPLIVKLHNFWLHFFPHGRHEVPFAFLAGLLCIICSIAFYYIIERRFISGAQETYPARNQAW